MIAGGATEAARSTPRATRALRKRRSRWARRLLGALRGSDQAAPAAATEGTAAAAAAEGSAPATCAAAGGHREQDQAHEEQRLRRDREPDDEAHDREQEHDQPDGHQREPLLGGPPVGPSRRLSVPAPSRLTRPGHRAG